MDRMGFKESMGLVEMSFTECKGFQNSMNVFFTSPAVFSFAIK
jgi:hypothetical protein